MMQRPENSLSLKFAAALVLSGLLLLSGCGTLDMGPDGGGGPQRRIYVNDVADNDSLPGAILGAGVYFIMQPGKQYSLKVEGAVAGEYLQVLAASNGVYNSWKTFLGTMQGTTQTYTIRDSLATAANQYLVFLRGAAGAGTLPAEVRLVPTVPGSPDTLKVHLVMVRTLTPPSGSLSLAAKATFAHSFMDTLASIYAANGIVLDTSFEILDPTGPAFTVDFSGTTIFPGGARIPNSIYMYLVQNITLDGKPNPDGTILGFAPREAFDMASSEEVLSVEKGADPGAIAITAAHEMGHFFGLRHTTSTQLDQRGDDDLSNIEDGFTGTGVCGGLTKRMAEQVSPTIRIKQGHPYCLRIAVDFSHCSATCSDITNLMFPYQCDKDSNRDTVVQKTLVPEQSLFVRQNLSLFQH